MGIYQPPSRFYKRSFYFLPKIIVLLFASDKLEVNRVACFNLPKLLFVKTHCLYRKKRLLYLLEAKLLVIHSMEDNFVIYLSESILKVYIYIYRIIFKKDKLFNTIMCQINYYWILFQGSALMRLYSYICTIVSIIRANRGSRESRNAWRIHIMRCSKSGNVACSQEIYD